MYLHCGLLIALVPSNVERTHGGAWGLRHGGPRIPAARDILQQIQVESGGTLSVLHIHSRSLGVNSDDVLDASYFQARIQRGRESAVSNMPF